MPSTATVTANLIQSYVGFKRPDRFSNSGIPGGFSAPRPVLQTVRTLDGVETAITGETTSTLMLYVPPLAPFEYLVGSTSTAQLVRVINSGTVDITIYEIAPYSAWVETTTIFGYLEEGPPPYVLEPGDFYPFYLSYYSNITGQFDELLSITSNALVGTYLVSTFQDVYSAFGFELSTATTNVTTTVWGQNSSRSVDLIPIINGVVNYDTVLDFTASLTGSPGWSFTTGTNSVNLTWDPDYVNNVNSATGYTATLVVSVPGVGGSPPTVTNTAIVNIDYSRYANLSTWISPSAPNNSFIGISLDKFDGDKILTIGVGSGADGSPVYDEGGSVFVRMRNLGIGSASLDTPYPYWSTVYSIPLTATIQTYLSGEIGGDGLPLYVKKNTDGLNYADYFGFEQSIGSMFVVTYNGYDLVNIDINNLRELSGDTDFDLTMENITRAFHYYSEIDNLGRINNLPQYPFTTSTTYTLSTSTTPLPLGETRTRLFRGFVKTWRPFVNSTGTNVIGSGSGAAFDVTTNDPGYSVFVHPGSVGTGYNNNDTIKILGSALGGVTPTNDLLITVTTSSGSVTGIVTATGFSASWIVDTSIVPLPS